MSVISLRLNLHIDYEKIECDKVLLDILYLIKSDSFLNCLKL